MLPPRRDLTIERPAIFVIDDEYEALADVVCASERATVGIRLLWEEIKRAVIVPAAQAPSDLVRMGAHIHLTDLTKREQRRVKLVFPHEATEPSRISVARSLGAALIGLRAGDRFAWRDGQAQLRAVRVNRVETPA